MKVYEDLTAAQEEAIKSESRKKCVSDLHYLAKHVLGYNKVTDHYHKQMAVDIDTSKYKFKLLLHPRGHYKSTLGTESYSIQEALRNANARILLTNVKLDNARKFLRAIAHHFTSNPKFRWIWRDWWIQEYASEFDRAAMKDKLDWVVRHVQDELTLLRPYAGREATITTGAVDASMVSQHYSLIIADDLINREFVRTQDMVEKSIMYFRDLLDLLDPDGTMLIIGTKWSHMDLYTWIVDEFGHKAIYSVPDFMKEGSYKGHIERAKKTPEEEKDWLISVCPTSVENPVFPEEFSSSVLRSLLEAKGPYEFGAQYQLDPTPTEYQKFKEEWMRPLDIIQESWLRTLDIGITVDPAISLDDQACDSAVAVCGYDENNYMYFLDGLNERLTEDELLEALFSLVVTWSEKGKFVLPVGFEAIGFQQLYVYNLERMMLERDFFFGIEPVTRRAMSKEERILRLVPRIKNGFFVPRKLMKESYSDRGKPYDLVQKLKWELLKFPFAGKMDLADALADQLDVVKAKSLPNLPKEDIGKRKGPEFVHPSVVEDRHRRVVQKKNTFSYAVRSR